MDTKTLNLNFGDGEVDKLKDVLRRMGEFIAYFEAAEQKMERWKHDIQETVKANQEQLNHQLLQIRDVTDDLREVMTDAGVARWRIAAESSLQQGKEHLKAIEAASQQHLEALQASNEEFSNMAKKSFDRLDRASAYTIKNISEAISSFRVSDFQRLTEESCEIVRETSSTVIKRLKDTVKWFHWKNLAMAFAVTVFATLTIGLYLNDEMPWEIHKQVVAQRNAGEALMHAWNNLPENERQVILQHSKKSFT